jgi:two-component system cell cycle sensor histidine kinase/response regulator CckA
MNKSHILVVEDEVIVRMHLQKVLANFEYDVTLATGNGEEAIEMAGSLNPDLILMDIALPGGMNGIETAKVIKERFDIPVVYVSGNADIPTIQRARETDPYGYVMKPINVPDLFSTIDTALHRHGLLKRLKESEERYRRITKATTDYIFTVRLENGRAVETVHGPACEAVTGYRQEEFSADPLLWINMVHHDDREAVHCRAEETAAGEDTKPLEHRIWRKDGALRWVRNTSVIHCDEKGRVLSYDGLIQDITERKLAEEALRESEARFRALVESSSDWVWAIDSQGNYSYSSPKVTELIGYEPDEVIGRSPLSFMPQDELARISKTVQDIINNREPFIALENTNVHKDGRRIVLETNGLPFFDEKGNFQGFRGIDRNITERKLAEEALRESEERFRALVQNSQDMIVVINREGIITYENPSVKANLGYELLGKHYKSLIHRDDLQRAVKDFEEVVGKTNPHTPSMFRIKHANGSWLYFEVLAENLFDNASVQGLLMVCRNVTERMKVQTALMESEERYRALFDQSPVGILLFDDRLAVTECNDHLARIVQTPRRELVGFNLARIKDKEVIQKFRETLQGHFSYYEGPYHVLARKMLIYITMAATPLRNTEGGVIGGFCIIQDVTEKRLADEKLKASEERTRLLVENANVGIVVVKDHRVVFANPKFMELSTHSFDEITSQSFSDFFHPDDRSIVSERFRAKTAGSHRAHDYEVRLMGGGYHVRWVELNSVFFNWEGSPAHLCFLNDITERKWAEEERSKIEHQIQQTQKLESLGVLAGGIAHDFNNLLMAILGNIDLALMDLATGSSVRSNLLEAAKASHRAADLCRQMLAYSGRGQFVSEVLDLNDLIKDMRHMLEISISKKAMLRYHLSSEQPAILADPTQIRQIVMNLVINASDAINETSGVIIVTSGVMECDQEYLSGSWLDEKLQEGRYVFLEVADTGCGMDRDILPKIFDPFFTTKFTGRGLGLAAVLGIVRGHKGAIKVESTKDRGTTFKVLFPAASIQAEPCLVRDSSADKWTGEGMILLADDEETVRMLGKKMLERCGYKVLMAKDGTEAIRLYRTHKDDITCCILDLTMPHMDGEETFRELRRIKSDVRVIVSSGYNEQEITERFFGKGLSGFLQKPYQIKELSAKLKEVLGQKEIAR